MTTQSLYSKQLLRKLLSAFFLMFVLPTAYLLVYLVRFAFPSPGMPPSTAGLRQSLLIGVPAIAVMSVAAFCLLARSFSQLRRIVADMKGVLNELETDTAEDAVEETADEVTCISRYLGGMKDAFQMRIAALDGDREALRAVNEQLAEAALVDRDTGLYNRKYGMKVLSIEVPRAIRRENPLSVLIIDADEFALVNKEYGREVGNQVIKELATLIDTQTRRVDMVARYGGEEFLVILPETDFNDATRVAERVRRAVSEHAFCDGKPSAPALTVTIGLATLDGGIMDSEKLLTRAEHSLMTAKGIGANMVFA